MEIGEGSKHTKNEVKQAKITQVKRPEKKNTEVAGKSYYIKSDTELLQAVREKLRLEREAQQHTVADVVSPEATKPKRKSRAIDRSEAARRILENNTQLATELTEDERQELVKRLQTALKYREKSMIGIIGNLARKGILQASHVTSDGKIAIDQLDEATREKYQFLKDYRLSTRSKLRQEAQTRQIDATTLPIFLDNKPDVSSDIQAKNKIPAPSVIESSITQSVIPSGQTVDSNAKQTLIATVRSRFTEFFSRLKRNTTSPEVKTTIANKDIITRRAFNRRLAQVAISLAGAAVLDKYIKFPSQTATTATTMETAQLVPKENITLRREVIPIEPPPRQPLVDNPPLMASGDAPPPTDEFKPVVAKIENPADTKAVEPLTVPETQPIEKPNFSLLFGDKPYDITQGFGETEFCRTKKPRPYGPLGHTGFDFGTPSGTTLTTPVDGKVVFTSMNNGNYGGTVIVETTDGHFLLYGHMKQVTVKTDSIVTPLTPLGLSGGNPADPGVGKSFGAHLHFEIQKRGADGSIQYINPTEYFSMANITIADEAKNDFPQTG